MAAHMRVKVGELDQSFVEKKCTELVKRGWCGCGFRPLLLLQRKSISELFLQGTYIHGELHEDNSKTTTTLQQLVLRMFPDKAPVFFSRGGGDATSLISNTHSMCSVDSPLLSPLPTTPQDTTCLVTMELEAQDVDKGVPLTRITLQQRDEEVFLV